jgi:cytochrome c oxidase assembly factor 3
MSSRVILPQPQTQHNHPAQPQPQPTMRSTSILRSIMNNNKTSYYEPHTYRMSPALLRARQPYFVKNMIGLAILMAVPVGIYAYTYNFLNQDDFDDIPIPPLDDETIKKLQKEYEEEKKSII